MSILKIKNEQNQWIQLPVLKGQTGPPGPQGLQGPKGDKGDKGDPGQPGTNMEIHICSITEYDANTRVPTIVNPDSSTFYLVPSQDGISPDLFTEWVYVNNAWEMFGSAKIDLSRYLIDVTVNGNSVVTNGVAEISIEDTADYERLQNLPSIEGVTLIGDKTFPQLNMSKLTNSEIEALLQ